MTQYFIQVTYDRKTWENVLTVHREEDVKFYLHQTVTRYMNYEIKIKDARVMRSVCGLTRYEVK